MSGLRISNGAQVNTALKEMVPLTSLFDSRPNPETLRECLEQFSQRISAIRVLIGHNEHTTVGTTRQCIQLAHRFNVPTVTRVESPRVVINRGVLPIYLDLCGETGVSRIQFRKTSLQHGINPREVVALADDRNLDIQFEITEWSATRGPESEQAEINEGIEWLEAGALNLVASVTRQSVVNENGRQSQMNMQFAERLARTFGLHAVMFTAATESEQTPLLKAFGEETHICDVPFADVVRVEKMRSEVSLVTSFSAEVDFTLGNRRSDNRSGQRNY